MVPIGFVRIINAFRIAQKISIFIALAVAIMHYMPFRLRFFTFLHPLVWQSVLCRYSPPPIPVD
jgi:hypothetical protein